MTAIQAIPYDFSFSHPKHSSLKDRRNPLASVSARAALLSVSLAPGGNHTAFKTSNDTHASPLDASSEYDGPPILLGHPDQHLKNGIVKAALASAAHKPDAEAAFFVADIGQVYRQHLRWRKCLPEVEPFYAVKANPDPVVLRLLASLGTGFDCASQNEINMVLGLGTVDPSRIIFANPCKANSFIRHAARTGVDMMTFDNTDELYKIARCHPGAKLVVRILTDDSKSLCRLGLKFGAPLVTVPSLLAKARELDLDVIGVSFHVGSGCYDSSAFTDAIQRAKAAFEMGQNEGYTFSLLDVGGGFEDAHFEDTAAILNTALDQHFPDRRGIKITAEPGRFYVSTAFTLATNIIARRARAPDSGLVENSSPDNPSVMYYINDGVYGSFNCIMFDHQHPIPYCLTIGKVLASAQPDQNGPGATVGSSVWGPTCDSIDCVCPFVDLPVALEVGDWLGFKNMGAYTVCAASQFNGFETSPVVYTAGTETVVGALLGAW